MPPAPMRWTSLKLLCYSGPQASPFKRFTKLLLDCYLSKPYVSIRQKDWRHVRSRPWFDGNGRSLAADGRARRAGARTSASSVGNPALSEGRTEKVRRKYRKYRKPQKLRISGPPKRHHQPGANRPKLAETSLAHGEREKILPSIRCERIILRGVLAVQSCES